jgi:hypothetical protein
MADFFYDGTLAESIAMLADILALGRGFKILHNPGPFETDQPRWFYSVDDELVRLLDSDVSFVLGGPFTRHPLGFRPRVNNRRQRAGRRSDARAG